MFEFSEWQTKVHGSFIDRANRLKLLDQSRPQIVLHLAWHSTDSPNYESDPIHLRWAEESINFAHECLRRDVWFLCTGSAADRSQPINHHLRNSNYSESKIRLRQEFLNLPAPAKLTWLQPQYVFSMVALRPRLLRAVIQSSNPDVFIPSNPDSLHDFIHIDDTATAICTVLRHSIISDVHIGSGRQISTLDFAETVKFQSGFRDTLPRITEHQSLETAKPLSSLGWLPIATNKFFGFDKEQG